VRPVNRYWIVGAAAGLVLVGTAVVAQAVTRPASGGYSATVTACEVGTGGLVEVGYRVTNHDPVVHGYRVLVTVSAGSTPLGWGQSQINRVAPGGTESARVPVTLSGTAGHPTCTVHADVNDGRSGHHADAPSPSPRQ